MNEQDKILLETYMLGFNDELDGRVKIWNPNPLLLRAYSLGRQDAIVSVNKPDGQFEEILNRIRIQNVEYKNKMKEQILEISKRLEECTIDTKQARKELCILFDVKDQNSLL